MDIYTIGFLILFAGIVLTLIFAGNGKLRVKIKSLKSGETYTAEKKSDSKGNKFIDWFYFDEDGKSIESEPLKAMIFDAFGDEDWHGDYEFYTNAETKVEAIEVESEKQLNDRT